MDGPPASFFRTVNYQKPVALVQPAIVDLFSRVNGEIRSSTGTIIDKEGIILTSANLVMDFESPIPPPGHQQVFIRLAIIDPRNGSANDFEPFVGSVLHVNKHLGTALVQFDPKKAVPTARLGSAKHIRKFDDVMSSASPLGISCTCGIIYKAKIEALNVFSGETMEFFMVNSNLYPGDGCPVANMDGEVIGLLLMRHHQDYRFNFALPIDTIVESLKMLKKDGKFQFKEMAPVTGLDDNAEVSEQAIGDWLNSLKKEDILYCWTEENFYDSDEVVSHYFTWPSQEFTLRAKGGYVDPAAPNYYK